MADFARSPSPATALQPPPSRMHTRRRSKSTGGELMQLFPFDSKANVNIQKFEQPVPFSTGTPISASTPTSPTRTARASPSPGGGFVLATLPRPSAPVHSALPLESIFLNSDNMSAPSTITRARSLTAPDQLAKLQTTLSQSSFSQTSLSQELNQEAKSSHDRDVVERLAALNESVQSLSRKVDSIPIHHDEKTSDPQEDQVALLTDLRSKVSEIQRNVSSVREAQKTHALEESENKRKAKQQLKEQDKVTHELQEAREALSSSSKLTPNQFGEIHSSLSTLFEHMKYAHGLEDHRDEKTQERVMEMEKLLGDVGDKIDSLEENQRDGGSVSPAEGAILRMKLRGMVEKLANLEQSAQVQVQDVLRKLDDVSHFLESFRDEVHENAVNQPQPQPLGGGASPDLSVIKAELEDLHLKIEDCVGGMLQVSQGQEKTGESMKMLFDRLNARPVAVALPQVASEESLHKKSTAIVDSPASSVVSHGKEGEGETPRVDTGTPRMDDLKGVSLRLDEISSSLQELKLRSSSRHEGEEEKGVNAKLDVVSNSMKNVNAKLTQVLENVSALDEHAVASRTDSQSSELSLNETKDRFAELLSLISEVSQSIDTLRNRVGESTANESASNERLNTRVSEFSQKLDKLEGTQLTSADTVMNSVAEVQAKLSQLGAQMSDMRTVIEQRDEVKSSEVPRTPSSEPSQTSVDILNSLEDQLSEFSTQMQDYFAPELQKINDGVSEKITSECKEVLANLEMMASVLLQMKKVVESESQSMRDTVTEFHELTGRRLMEEIAPRLAQIDTHVKSLSKTSDEILSSHKSSAAENSSLQEQVRRVIENISTNENMTDDLLKGKYKSAAVYFVCVALVLNLLTMLN